MIDVSRDNAVEVITWDAVDHTDLPGFAHGLTRYGSNVDPLEALGKVFSRLREAVAERVPDPQYFTVELRVVSKRALRRLDTSQETSKPADK
jgi:hypothetical protein